MTIRHDWNGNDRPVKERHGMCVDCGYATGVCWCVPVAELGCDRGACDSNLHRQLYVADYSAMIAYNYATKTMRICRDWCCGGHVTIDAGVGHHRA